MRHAIANDAISRRGLLWLYAHPEANGHADALALEALPVAETGAPLPHAFEAIRAQLTRDFPDDASRPADRDARQPLGTIGYHVAPPSGESRSVTAGDLLQLTVPLNWQRVLGPQSVVFAPDGAFIATEIGAIGVTHGLQIGLARSLTGELDSDMRILLTALGRDNPSMT